MEEADNTEESAEDITAADTDPRPKNAMKGGQRCCNTIGRIILASSETKVPFSNSPLKSVSLQSEIKQPWVKYIDARVGIEWHTSRYLKESHDVIVSQFGNC